MSSAAPTKGDENRGRKDEPYGVSAGPDYTEQNSRSNDARGRRDHRNSAALRSRFGVRRAGIGMRERMAPQERTQQ